MRIKSHCQFCLNSLVMEIDKPTGIKPQQKLAVRVHKKHVILALSQEKEGKENRTELKTRRESMYVTYAEWLQWHFQHSYTQNGNNSIVVIRLNLGGNWNVSCSVIAVGQLTLLWDPLTSARHCTLRGKLRETTASGGNSPNKSWISFFFFFCIFTVIDADL